VVRKGPSVRIAVLSPVGFHFIMLLKSCVSCSSAHGSLSSSSCDCEGPEACGVCGCVSARGVEAALAFAFLRGGIADEDRKCGVEGRLRTAAGTAAEVQGCA
jgi:hypothetical protein